MHLLLGAASSKNNSIFFFVCFLPVVATEEAQLEYGDTTPAVAPPLCDVQELTLILVRHGETPENSIARIQGQQDTLLSENGRAQARLLAARFSRVWDGAADSSFPAATPDCIYTSDLSRAIETAQIIKETVSSLSPLRIVTSPLLRERGFGVWEGLTAAEVRSRYPGVAEPPGGEGWEQVKTRVQRAITMIWDQCITQKSRLIGFFHFFFFM